MTTPPCLRSIPIAAPFPTSGDLAVMLLRLALIIATTLLALFLLERKYQLISDFRSETSSALNLAIARIAIMGTLLWNVRLNQVLNAASLGRALMSPFFLWGRLAMHMPIQHDLLVALYVVFLASAVCGLLGLGTRFACGIATATAFYLLTIRQLFGQIDHIHQLVIFPLILALAPAGDALSLDALRRARHHADPRPPNADLRSRAYAFPLQTMVLFVALCYYFPGAWKISRLGLEWFRPRHMGLLLATENTSLWRIHLAGWLLAHPVFLFAGALGTVVFELGFLFAVLSRRLRPFAGLAALAFHIAIFLTMTILFGNMLSTYVIFFDWSAMLAWANTRLHRTAPAASPPTISSKPSTALKAVSAAILAGMVLTGVAHRMDSWPLGCFPTFDWPIWPYSRAISLQGVDRLGVAHDWNLTEGNAFETHQMVGQRMGLVHAYSKQAAPPHQQSVALATIWLAHLSGIQLDRVVISSDVFFRPGPLQPERWVSRCPIDVVDLQPAAAPGTAAHASTPPMK